jgi:uncharacterized lipoprotein YddW (UPF0748 family)
MLRTIYTLILFLFIAQILFSCQATWRGKHEVRAVWMSRFEYAKDKSTEESKRYISEMFKNFHSAGMNIIIFQVRGNGDAFYQSEFEPWSNMLSDSIGVYPSWDPLQLAVETAHDLGLEIHAWINTFPAWRANEAPPEKSQPLHPYLAHPEWVVCDSAGHPMQPEEGYICFSPGIPAVQEYIINVAIDIVRKYDIDGMHFDYIRYPEDSDSLGYSHDSISVRRASSVAGNPYQYDWPIWQREQVNEFVLKAYNRITNEKPWIKVSAAVIGHHYGSGWNGYHEVYQDARRWLASGKMDLVFPMTYNRIGHPTAAYEQALSQWKEMIHLGRYIIPGIATYKVDKEYSWGEVWDQIEMIRSEGFPGMVFFSSQTISRKIHELKDSYYTEPALVPPMVWKKNVPQVVPDSMQLTIQNDSLFFMWAQNEDVFKYVLYDNSNIDDVENIIAILPGKQTMFTMPNTAKTVQFYLTAINRIGVESEPVAFMPLITGTLSSN